MNVGVGSIAVAKGRAVGPLVQPRIKHTLAHKFRTRRLQRLHIFLVWRSDIANRRIPRLLSGCVLPPLLVDELKRPHMLLLQLILILKQLQCHIILPRIDIVHRILNHLLLIQIDHSRMDLLVLRQVWDHPYSWLLASVGDGLQLFVRI